MLESRYVYIYIRSVYVNIVCECALYMHAICDVMCILYTYTCSSSSNSIFILYYI